MAERRVMNKTEFSVEQYGESHFHRIYNKLKRKKGARQELEEAYYTKESKKLTVKQQDVFIKYLG